MLIRKVTFLLDKKNDWIQHYLKNYINKFPKKYKYNISKNPRKIKNKIVFVLSYTKILVKHNKYSNIKPFAPLRLLTVSILIYYLSRKFHLKKRLILPEAIYFSILIVISNLPDSFIGLGALNDFKLSTGILNFK